MILYFEQVPQQLRLFILGMCDIAAPAMMIAPPLNFAVIFSDASLWPFCWRPTCRLWLLHTFPPMFHLARRLLAVVLLTKTLPVLHVQVVAHLKVELEKLRSPCSRTRSHRAALVGMVFACPFLRNELELRLGQAAAQLSNPDESKDAGPHSGLRQRSKGCTLQRGHSDSTEHLGKGGLSMAKAV